MSLLHRFASFFRNRKLDQDLDDELRAHLEMRMEDNQEAGLSAEAARQDAIGRFGNKAVLKENTRMEDTLAWLESVLQDARYGLRTLRRSPVFTVVAILAIALSIGAATSVFTVVNAILLPPLPYQQPRQLVSIGTFDPRINSVITPGSDFGGWRDQNKTLAHIAAFTEAAFNFSGIGEPDRIPGAQVTADFFPMLGVQPQMGRTFSTGECQPGGENVALLTHQFWQTRFGGADDVIGKKFSLDNRLYQVIGVLPPGFQYPSHRAKPDILLPLQLPTYTQEALASSIVIVNVIGRLKPDVPTQQVQADLDRITQALVSQYPEEFRAFFSGRKVRVESLQKHLIGDVQRPLLTMLAAVGFVLLIGCLNIASLQLARAVERGGEVGVRAALGAKRSRLFRQFMTENILLSALGAVMGLALAFWLVSLMRGAGVKSVPQYATLHVDGWVLAFTLFVTLGSGLFFGLVPALWIRGKQPLASVGKDMQLGTGRTHHRLRNALVVIELSLVVVLLTGAGLMVHSFSRLMRVDEGMNIDNVLTARIALTPSSYPDVPQQTAFFDQLMRRMQAAPGVRSVALANSLPLTPPRWHGGIRLEGKPDGPPGLGPMADCMTVSSTYFQTLQIPIAAGRPFEEHDTETGSPVAIVNQVFAAQYFPGEQAVGKRIATRFPNAPWITVVGVAANVHHFGLERAVQAEVFFPYRQLPKMMSIANMEIAVRYQGDLSALTAALRHEVKALDASQPISEIATMEQLLSESVAARRLNTILLASFAMLALALATVGIYGVMSYSVAQRSHEIGIRMALGSNQGRVLKLVLGEAIILTLCGVGLGITGALLLTRYMASLLFAVKASDPLTMVSVSLLLIAVGTLAGYVPAYRASRVDPMVVLRHE
ncbi:MAG TPA: ABC transporter permease [Alphaproteobacteria bacterium]|nr:ABC transporter permease [Alphaproteobacteria bacterium]